jgi:hypothetical protein
MTLPTIILFVHAFIVAGMCLPSRLLAVKEGVHFTKPLLRNDRRDTHTDIRLMGRVYEVRYSDGLIFHDIAPSFIQTLSGI